MPTTPASSALDRTADLHLLTTQQVAEILVVAPRTVRALAARGELRKVKLGTRASRYFAADVEALIERRTTTPNEVAPAGNGRDEGGERDGARPDRA